MNAASGSAAGRRRFVRARAAAASAISFPEYAVGGEISFDGLHLGGERAVALVEIGVAAHEVVDETGHSLGSVPQDIHRLRGEKPLERGHAAQGAHLPVDALVDERQERRLVLEPAGDDELAAPRPGSTSTGCA